VFSTYPGLGPPKRTGPSASSRVTGRRLMKDVFETSTWTGGLPADVPQGVVQGGLPHRRSQRRWKRPGQVQLQQPVATPATHPGLELQENVAPTLEGLNSTPRVEQALASTTLSAPRLRVPRAAQNLGSEHPLAKGPHLAPGQGRLRRSPTSHAATDSRPELHRPTRGPAPIEDFWLHGDA